MELNKVSDPITPHVILTQLTILLFKYVLKLLLKYARPIFTFMYNPRAEGIYPSKHTHI